MRSRAFKQVDVFTATLYLGNPLAVVLDGQDLSTDDMQHFARWTNLSETAFVLLPTADGVAAGADYRVRIFTPGAELPFAGHPTLGTCHAWLEAGGVPRAPGLITQECGVGLVQIRRDDDRLAFAAPPMQRSTPTPALLAQVISALGLQPQQLLAAQLLDNGPVWLGLLLDSPYTVLELNPDRAALKDLDLKVGVAGIEHAQTATNLIARSNREARAFGKRSVADSSAELATVHVEVRAFAASMGIQEDPVTGSLNASLAQWLVADGHAPNTYVATQGTCLDRAGRVYITQEDHGQVWVGGHSVTCITGEVRL